MCAQLHVFAVQTILSFWMGLRKIFTKECAQSYNSSLWRLTWVFDGTRKKFLQKSVPSHTFLRCGDYLKFLRGLGKFRQKGVTSYTFFSQCRLKFWIGLGKIFTKMCAQFHVFAVQTILSFWMGLRKVSTKMCAQLHVFSLWRLSWVFDGPWKNFHKKVCPVICFFAVQTILKFWWDLEKFSQKSVPSHMFLRCGD